MRQLLFFPSDLVPNQRRNSWDAPRQVPVFRRRKRRLVRQKDGNSSQAKLRLESMPISKNFLNRLEALLKPSLLENQFSEMNGLNVLAVLRSFAEGLTLCGLVGKAN